MEFGAGSRKVLPAEKLKQHPVASFREIIAPLIGNIDEALGSGYVLVAGLWRTGRILRMPKLKVGQMLLCHRPLQPAQGRQHGRRLLMPFHGAPVVQQNDRQGVQGEGLRRTCGHGKTPVRSVE